MKYHLDSTTRKSGKSIVVPVLMLTFAFLAVLPTAPKSAEAAPPKHEIKIATLAPENSSLMQVFKEMDAELLRETGGEVGFKFFPGFVLGDEQDVLRKLRVGMVNAAVFTTTALTEVNPDVSVLQVPFLFDNYKEADEVMSEMDSDLSKGFIKHGYEVLGWSELGFIYFMSTVPVSSVEDLKGKKVWNVPSSPMTGALINKAGVSSVTVSIPDVLVSLQTNLLDVVYNSPYYALVTQWYTKIKYITDLPLSYVSGVVLMNKKTFDQIPPQHQETMKKICSKHLRILTEKTRKDNEDAMNAIVKRGVQKVTPTPQQVDGFKALSDRVMNQLGPKALPPETLKKVRSVLADYRKGH